MEKLVVEVKKSIWDSILHTMEWLEANVDYTIKEVKIEDDYFKDDPVWHTMRKESNDLYKRLKKYEWDQRQKIKK